MCINPTRHRNDDSKKPPKGHWFGPQPAAVSSPQLELAWGQEEGTGILGPMGHTVDTGSAARHPEDLGETATHMLSTPFLRFLPVSPPPSLLLQGGQCHRPLQPLGPILPLSPRPSLQPSEREKAGSGQTFPESGFAPEIRNCPNNVCFLLSLL